ncbi:hypothetical protein, partial [Streptomyces caelestis]|uniref:hypothetical protein n=1 Tax=Streptomyces caelestis TaxID=36816 RepID=UPI003F54606B
MGSVRRKRSARTAHAVVAGTVANCAFASRDGSAERRTVRAAPVTSRTGSGAIAPFPRRTAPVRGASRGDVQVPVDEQRVGRRVGALQPGDDVGAARRA